jgi:hypothetical protein
MVEIALPSREVDRGGRYAGSADRSLGRLRGDVVDVGSAVDGMIAVAPVREATGVGG